MSTILDHIITGLSCLIAGMFAFWFIVVTDCDGTTLALIMSLGIIGMMWRIYRHSLRCVRCGAKMDPRFEHKCDDADGRREKAA